MKKTIPMAFIIVAFCCIIALGLGSCRKANNDEIFSENHSVRLYRVGQLNIAAGQPAQFAVELSPNLNPNDVVAVFTTDEGEVVKSAQAKSVYITFNRSGLHKLGVKVYLPGVSDRILCQSQLSIEVK